MLTILQEPLQDQKILLCTNRPGRAPPFIKVIKLIRNGETLSHGNRVFTNTQNWQQ